MAAESFGGGGGNTVVIDLGLDRGEPDTYASPSRSTVPGWFGPVVTAVLVLLCLAASAAPPPPALSPLLSLRVGPADSYALTDDDELLAQTLGTISAYDLGAGVLRWQTEQDRPTYRLRTAAAALPPGDRLPVPAARDEVRALAEELNALLARRDEAVARLERFTGDAAHELRSPVAAIRARSSSGMRTARPSRTSIASTCCPHSMRAPADVALFTSAAVSCPAPPTGTGKPIFFRASTGGGSSPRIARRRTYFVVQPRRSLSRTGRRAVNSTSLWSRNGTRLSIEAAIDI